MRKKFVTATPSWRAVLPILTSAIKSKMPSAQKNGYSELNRMAEAADKWNEHCEAEAKKRETAKLKPKRRVVG